MSSSEVKEVNTKHTPGPWSLISVEGKLCPAGKGQMSILTIVTEDDGTKFACVYEPEDAHLIAAAPDMLEALKLAVDQLERLGSDGLASGALAAIAKAEGQS